MTRAVRGVAAAWLVALCAAPDAQGPSQQRLCAEQAAQYERALARLAEQAAGYAAGCGGAVAEAELAP